MQYALAERWIGERVKVNLHSVHVKNSWERPVRIASMQDLSAEPLKAISGVLNRSAAL